MPVPGGLAPVTITDHLLVDLLAAQRELIDAVQGLRQDLASTRPDGVRPDGLVDVREPQAGASSSPPSAARRRRAPARKPTE